MWQELGIELKGKTAGQHKITCPRCKGKDHSLSVNIDQGVYKCHRPSCDFHGTVKPSLPKKEYIKPESKAASALSEHVLNWFKNRGISAETLAGMKVSESKEFMPQVSKNTPCINFNYYRKGELVNIKFRDREKNFKLVSGAELIFYGLDLIENDDEAIICEGEIDQLSFYESACFTCVSVPNGASKGASQLQYLDNCYTYFENKTKIYLATDTDAPGLALREELARRLGKERCWIINFPEGCKDANDVLVKLGKDVLRECKQNATQFPIEGIQEIAEIDDEIDALYAYGFPKAAKIGYPKFDELISWKGGELTIITGIPNSGKSEFMDQVYVRLSARHGWKFGVFSAENQPTSIHFAKLAEKYIGEPFYHSTKKMSMEMLVKAKAFIGDNFFFVKTQEVNLTIEGLLDKAKELVMRKGIHAFVVDPWNYIEHNIPNGQSETQYINKVLTKIVLFAKSYNIHFFLVAHPTKIKKDLKSKKFDVATMYDISGSAHFFNKTDNGISVYRDFESGEVHVYVQKIRYKWIGKVGMAEFYYDLLTGRYKEINQLDFDKEITSTYPKINTFGYPADWN